MDQFDALIREIAEKHGIVVGRDDPILVMQTINMRLMQDTAKAQQVQLDQFKEELESLSQRWGADAKEKAERILNAALDASKGAMEQRMQDSAMKAAATVADEVSKAMNGTAARAQQVRTIAWLNVFASCATLFAAAIMLWAGS